MAEFLLRSTAGVVLGDNKCRLTKLDVWTAAQSRMESTCTSRFTFTAVGPAPLATSSLSKSYTAKRTANIGTQYVLEAGYEADLSAIARR